jgi:Rps23 Pro-64 3,4-dihydroxylase Tpa1-like proline 4-hydroxylase
MPISEEFGRFLAGMLDTIKSESIEWQKQHLADQINLRREKEIAATQLRFEIERLEAQFRAEKIRIEEAERRKSRDFSEYLDSIDEAKNQFVQRYPEMSKPIALMICHHASELLKEAWNNPDANERVRKHKMYSQFMVTMCQELSEGCERKALPEKTLNIIYENKY